MSGSTASSQSAKSKEVIDHARPAAGTCRSITPTTSGNPYTRFRKPSILPLKGPTLENLKLASILNNETCSPISFKDFTNFISEKEHTAENLLFAIWYRSYAARWRDLKEDVQKRVPVPSTRLGDRYDPFTRGRGSDVGTNIDAASMMPIGEQPMREEAARAFSTFLRSGGSRALGVSDDLRQFARTCLAKSSAPECFLPIYEEVYHTLETQSLPHFLSYASTNVNQPKQMFWYYVGAFDFCLGLVIYLILTLLLPAHHFGFRAIRLISTIFTTFGSMQIYSAWRGFCSQVWNRKSRQLRPWEMDEVVDEEVSLNGKEDTEMEMAGNWESIPTLTEPTANRSVTPAANSMFNENVFTSTTPPPNMDLQLSPEVRPLTDLGDISLSPVSIDELRPLPIRETTPEDDGGSEELNEQQIRQLAVRRSTIKVPDASLAFPISEDDHVGELTNRKTSHRLSTAGVSLRPSISSVGSSLRQSMSPLPTPIARRSDISPFEEPSTAPETGRISVEPKLSMTSLAAAQQDLGDILGKFKRPKNRVTVAEAGGPKMFGPEVLVEDPRVTALFEGLVRDILVVGAVATVAWIALCLAVPCAGLV